MRFSIKGKDLLKLLGTFSLYFATAKFGLHLGAVSGFATLVWPPAGIALAALLVFGRWVWPAVFLGAFLTNFSEGAPFFVSMGMAIGNSLEAVFACYLLRRVQGFSPTLERLKDVLSLIFLAAGLSTLLSSSIGVSSLYLGGMVVSGQFWSTFLAWWAGDALGMVVVAPWLLYWAHCRRSVIRPAALAEVAILATGLAITCMVVFSHIPFLPSVHPPIAYVVFPFLIWAALRFGLAGAVNTSLLLGIFTVWSTVRGYGPFAHTGSLSEGLLYLAVFHSVTAITGLILAALTIERKQALEHLHYNQELLERKVKIRTEKLRDTENRFSMLIHGAKDYAIFMMDPNGLVVSWNEGARRIKGYEEEEIIGRNYSVFFRPDDAHAGKPQMQLDEAAANGRYEADGWRVRKDGTLIWANVVVAAMRNKDGNLVGFSKITRDISEQKRTADALQQAHTQLEKRVEERTEELQAALQARDEFLSIASHELKTPLTSLLLRLQLVRRGLAQIFSPTSATDPQLATLITPEKLTKSLEVSERQGKRLALLLDELLDLTRIRAGKLNLELEEVSLSAIVFETVERQKELAAKAGSVVSVSADTSLSGCWDKLRLEQIITNVLSNAIKYGKGKPIELSVEAAEGRHVALLKVKDFGMGIPPEMHSKIFEPYERALNGEGKNISGLGLGLYITRQIVEAHHGTIEFHSELGQGTVFVVSLPMSRNAAGPGGERDTG